MSALREAHVWVGSDAERIATIDYTTHDDLRQSLNTFCTEAEIGRKIFRLRGNGNWLNATSLPPNKDPVEIHIDTKVPGEHAAALGAVHYAVRQSASARL